MNDRVRKFGFAPDVFRPLKLVKILRSKGVRPVKRLLRYGLLCFALLVLGGFQGFYTLHVMRQRLNTASTVRAPFQFDVDQKVTFVAPEAAAAGLRKGDRVIAVDGQPFVAGRILEEKVERSRPSDAITVLADAEDGTRSELRVTLRARHASEHVIVTILIEIAVPIFCLLMAFWVVLLRSHDFRAWLLLALLSSFSLLVVESGWHGPLRPLALIYESAAPETFGIWLILFGLYFPEPVSWKRTINLLKWILIATIAVNVVLDCIVVAADELDFGMALLLRRHYHQLQSSINFLTLLSLCICFLCLAAKLRRAVPGTDAHRKVRLTCLGTLVGLGPTFALVVIALIRGVPTFQGVPTWGAITSTLLLPVFPCTLAYVIVVHRALEVRGIVRHGLKVAFDKRALRVWILAMIAMIAAVLYFTEAPAIVKGLACLLVGLLLIQSPMLPRWIDRRFFRSEYESEQILLHILDGAPTVRDPGELMELVSERISQALDVTTVAVLLEKGDNYCVEHWHGDGSKPPHCLPRAGEIMRLLDTQGKAIVIYFDDETSMVHDLPEEEQRYLLALNAQLLLPLKTSGGLLGAMSLGPKRSDHPYTSLELRLLRLVASESGMAIENSRLVAKLAAQIREHEQKNAEKLAAEESNRTKSEFIARMSHELRTPLNAILGYSEMLQEQAEEINAPEMITDLAKIHSAGKHLLGLINSILDIAKIESGRMDLFLENCAVEKLISEVLSIASPVIVRNGNTYHLEVDPAAGEIETDVTKLRQVLFNLISNAAKFTRNGLLTVRIGRHTLAGTEWIRFQIRDTGIGMTSPQLSTLFLPFRQADSSVTRKYGGTGLGLAISRQFCQIMGGDVVVESAPGVGSVFTVVLPASVSNYKKELNRMDTAAPALLPTSPRTLLVVDDDPVMHDLIGRFVAHEAVNIESAYSGEEGLRKVKELRPAVVTMDVIMPGMDGWTALRELKRDPGLAAIPVIMMSIIDDRRYAFSMGADDYLLKPVTRGEFIAVLNRSIRKAVSPATAAAKV